MTKNINTGKISKKANINYDNASSNNRHGKTINMTWLIHFTHLIKHYREDKKLCVMSRVKNTELLELGKPS